MSYPAADVPCCHSHGAKTTKSSDKANGNDFTETPAGIRKGFFFRERHCQPVLTKIKLYFYHQDITGECTSINVRKIVTATVIAVTFIASNLVMPIVMPLLTIVTTTVLSILITGICYINVVYNTFDDNSVTTENRILLRELFITQLEEVFRDLTSPQEVQASFNLYKQTSMEYKLWSYIYDQAGNFNFMRNGSQIMESDYIQKSVQHLQEFFSHYESYFMEVGGLDQQNITLIDRLKTFQSRQLQELNERICVFLQEAMAQYLTYSEKSRDLLSTKSKEFEISSSIESEEFEISSSIESEGDDPIEKKALWAKIELLHYLKENENGLLRMLGNAKPNVFLDTHCGLVSLVETKRNNSPSTTTENHRPNFSIELSDILDEGILLELAENMIKLPERDMKGRRRHITERLKLSHIIDSNQ